MESTAILTNRQISDAYEVYSKPLYKYILFKIGYDEELAKDMMQDAFLKLLEHRGEIRIDTVKALLYVIVRNIIIDYVRKQERVHEFVSEYYFNYEESSNIVESELNAKEISLLEYAAVSSLSGQRRRVYSLSQFHHLSVDEIALKMNISNKTVENHLHIGRREVRNYIRRCI